MFCPKCGKQLDDTQKFCDGCGTAIGTANQVYQQTVDAFNKAESSIGEEVKDFTNTINGNVPSDRKLKEDRNVVIWLLLSIITCGIYNYWFVYTIARDMNEACTEDGNKTPGLLMYIILSYVTCGFYSIYWQYSIANRMQENAPRYGLNFSENGTTVLMWDIVGMVLCCLGPIIGMNIICKNANALCREYNKRAC